MVKIVFALCLFINGSLVEHRIQDNLSTCLKMKREATRNMDMKNKQFMCCLLYTSPSPRDRQKSRMPSSA